MQQTLSNLTIESSPSELTGNRLLDSVPHMIWRARLNGSMEYFNRAWCDYTGIAVDDSLGLNWQAAFLRDEVELLTTNIRQAQNDGEKFSMNCRIRNHYGELRWHTLSVLPEFSMNGSVIGWLGTAIDIHDRKNAEIQAKKAKIDAVTANQAKANFLANMSHEIRTPLNAILGFTDVVMSSGQSDDQTYSHLETIKRNGYQLLRIIDEILDVSKVESGKLEISNFEFNLLDLLRDLHRHFQIQTKDRNLEFVFGYATPIPRSIVSDANRFRQILENIIGNAIKFTTKGRVEVAVSWTSSRNRGDGSSILQCSVKDTGEGIELAQSDVLFKPFSQVDGSMTRRFGGTGLGLALSRRLANALGGDVYIRNSQIGAGSEFIVEITAQTPSGTVFDQALYMAEELSSKSRFENALTGINVLVVDDALDNRILIGHFLTAAGAKVDFAVDGHDGVEKALTNKFHLILMDIQMPKLDGYEATAFLRSKEYTRPVIALTAHALKEERERSLKAGCDDHLTKPIDRKLLISQVARLAGQWQEQLTLFDKK